ncbi:hypothetical protein RPPS3_36130 [Rhodopseudomonas palustris]|nr:hypothetical protein RPPS3_36130 [Rhodopseudomonas palustris]
MDSGLARSLSSGRPKAGPGGAPRNDEREGIHDVMRGLDPGIHPLITRCVIVALVQMMGRRVEPGDDARGAKGPDTKRSPLVGAP